MSNQTTVPFGTVYNKSVSHTKDTSHSDSIIQYENILITVLQALEFSTVSKLPIDLFELVEKIPNLKMCSYTRFANRNRISISDACTLLGSNYGTYAYRPKTHQHMIYYNDTTGNEGLLRFTIAHELAHFYLSHSEKTKKNLTYKAIENEANFFARNLLAPMPLVNRILSDYSINSQNINRLMLCFHLSYKAAKVRLNACVKENELIQKHKEMIGFFDRFLVFRPKDPLNY